MFTDRTYVLIFREHMFVCLQIGTYVLIFVEHMFVCLQIEHMFVYLEVENLVYLRDPWVPRG